MPTEKPLTPDEQEVPFRKNRSWLDRFAVACRGIKIAARLEVSFFVHLFVAVIVLFAGVVLKVTRSEWCLIALCIATVLCAELLNTSLERIARVITRDQNQGIRDALDIASGAVLVAAIGAAVVGTLLLGTRFIAQMTG